MDNGKVMGRRQFFSKFFPVLTETIVEKTKDETKIVTNSSVVNSNVAKQAIVLEKAEAVEEVEENGGRKYPWVGM
jgi:predicted aspartyl protease